MTCPLDAATAATAVSQELRVVKIRLQRVEELMDMKENNGVNKCRQLLQEIRWRKGETGSTERGI